MLSKLVPRAAFGALAYWGANALLVAAEVKWHLLSLLVAVDLRAAEAIPALVVSKLLGVGISIALSSS